MNDGPLVEEIRKIRMEIEREHGGSEKELFEHAREFQKQFEPRLVRRAPRPALKRRSA